MKIIKRLELTGLILILISSFSQLFLLNLSSTITNNSIRYKIEKKIDMIYNASISNYQKLHPEVTEVNIWTNPISFREYTKAEDDTSFKMTSNQTEIISYIVGIFFIIGSGLLLLAKYRELKLINGTKEI
ncbi:hypothetical protein KKG72_01585 [bacterium]|nr:hypothetical protein [bacterium]MBU1993174.1 hypothetical protein [bacterium]